MSTTVESPTGSSNTVVSAIPGAGATARNTPSIPRDIPRRVHLVACMRIPVHEGDLSTSMVAHEVPGSDRVSLPLPHHDDAGITMSRSAEAPAICPAYAAASTEAMGIGRSATWARSPAA